MTEDNQTPRNRATDRMGAGQLILAGLGKLFSSSDQFGRKNSIGGLLAFIGMLFLGGIFIVNMYFQAKRDERRDLRDADEKAIMVAALQKLSEAQVKDSENSAAQARAFERQSETLISLDKSMASIEKLMLVQTGKAAEAGIPQAPPPPTRPPPPKTLPRK